MPRRPKGDSEMSGHERGQCIRYENIFHQKRDETYYSVYSSIWVHCTGSMARAGERGAIRKGCDAFKLGDVFGSE